MHAVAAVVILETNRAARLTRFVCFFSFYRIVSARFRPMSTVAKVGRLVRHGSAFAVGKNNLHGFFRLRRPTFRHLRVVRSVVFCQPHA